MTRTLLPILLLCLTLYTPQSYELRLSAHRAWALSQNESLPMFRGLMDGYGNFIDTKAWTVGNRRAWRTK